MFLVNRLQVISTGQPLVPVKVNGQRDRTTEARELIRVAKGTREFAMLQIRFPDQSIKTYVNEIMPNGQVEIINDDAEFEEISLYMDSYLNRIKPEGSDI